MTQIEEEWARPDQIEQIFGLRASYLRKLAEQGKIITKVLKDSPDARKGVRLYQIESIRKFINQHE